MYIFSTIKQSIINRLHFLFKKTEKRRVIDFNFVKSLSNFHLKVMWIKWHMI